MKTVHWKRANWLATRFVFDLEQQAVGHLLFPSSWNFDAVYTDRDTQLRFAQRSFWTGDVSITQQGEPIGTIRFGVLGGQSLTLVTGERFRLSTGFWQQAASWQKENGETVIRYEQAALGSSGKGIVCSPDALPPALETLLLSSGVYVRQLNQKRTAVMVAIVMPLIAGANRH